MANAQKKMKMKRMKKMIGNNIVKLYEGYFNDVDNRDVDSDDFNTDNYVEKYKYTVSFEFNIALLKNAVEIEKQIEIVKKRLDYAISLFSFIQNSSCRGIYLSYFKFCDVKEVFPNGLEVMVSSGSDFCHNLKKCDMFSVVYDLNFDFNSVDQFVRFKTWFYNKLTNKVSAFSDTIRIVNNDKQGETNCLSNDKTAAWFAIDKRFYGEVNGLVPLGAYGKYTKRHKIEDAGYFMRWYGCDVERVHIDSFDYQDFIDNVDDFLISLKKIHRVDNEKMLIVKDNGSTLEAPGLRSRDIRTIINYEDLKNYIDKCGCYMYFYTSNSFSDIKFSIVMDGTVVGNGEEYHVFITVDAQNVDLLYACLKLFSKYSGMTIERVHHKVEYLIESDDLQNEIVQMIKNKETEDD